MEILIFVEGMSHENQFLGLPIKQATTVYDLQTQKSFSLAPKVFLTFLHIISNFLKHFPWQKIILLPVQQVLEIQNKKHLG